MAGDTYTIKGMVLSRTTGTGISELRVEAWDKDHLHDDFIGSDVTDAIGAFQIEFSASVFQERFHDHRPDLYFKVFRDDRQIASTENAVLWNLDTGETPITIEVDLEGDDLEPLTYEVKGTVHLFDGFPATGVIVSAFDRDLRSEQTLGQTRSNHQGVYQIQYTTRQFRKSEKRRADLVVKAIAQDGSLLVASPVLFNAPASAEVDLTIPAEIIQPPSLFETIAQRLTPLLDGLPVTELEEDGEYQDLSFLAGETGLEREVLARFAMAHKLTEQGIQPEFWFALLGGGFYPFTDNQSLKEQMTEILDALPSLDAIAVGKALTRSFALQDIPAALREREGNWIEAFLQRIANRSGSEVTRFPFVKLALEHAGIEDAGKRDTFARLFNAHKALTPELLEVLEQDPSFEATEIADLRTSFQLAELTRGDFSVVKVIKEAFRIGEPDQIRLLAKKSEDEWVDLITEIHAAGGIELPIETRDIAGQVNLPEAEVYGKTLERQFREAYPTTAFAGGLERALQNGGAQGLRRADDLRQLLDIHPDFEFLTAPVDEFLDQGIHPDFHELATDPDFRREVKAAQRVFKLVPTFQATDALLADSLHSAQQIYRMGESEFVRRYADRPGFTLESARLAWHRAADTHASVLTVVSDLKSLEAEALPMAMTFDSAALTAFPNWNNLFQSGDLCECEHCRSVLSPAAYFADLLMFLKDRKAANPADTVKDILFRRRPDLGFLELNCANALTTLPYIDVVCEVLEDAVAAGENDVELEGFTTVPIDSDAAKAAVATAFSDEELHLGADFSLSQISISDPDRWVVHGDDVTYLLKKKATPNFFAETLRNTKASADELRAYPQYVNPKAYEKLREAKYPSSLPFDLFAEEVRAAFQKINLQRWELMRTLRGEASPNHPTDGEIAAEYFGISSDAGADFDEKRLILEADDTELGQQVLWGETGNAGWLETVSNVKTFLHKTGLTYNDMLALFDLKFINPSGDIAIDHLDASCDTEQKVIQDLDASKLDRIHRFLRLWRKLKSWQLWELDLVIRNPALGDGVLNEAFLIHLFDFSQLRDRLGRRTTVEHVCALFDKLNTETHFTELHEKREDALYQRLFLNRRLIQPLDPALQLDPSTGDVPVGDISDHHPVVLAALGIREADLVLLKTLTKASDGTPYITDDQLTLANLSFLWRHAWLANMLKFSAAEWQLVLELFDQDLQLFANPKAALDFLEAIDHLKATDFEPDALNWLLAADRSATSAVQGTDAARFLTGLRKALQAVQAEYDVSQYDFLDTTRVTDVDRLTALLTSLLQQLNRPEADIPFFIATIRDEVTQDMVVPGLSADFDFPADIRRDIRIRYDNMSMKIHFTGLMTPSEQTTLLTDASLATVTGIAAYQEAIEAFFSKPRLALKFYDPLFTAPLHSLPAEVDFKALSDADLSRNIAYDAEQRLLRFTGILSNEQQAALEALSADITYRNAVNSLATQPKLIAPPDERLWLLDADLQFPLRDLTEPVNDHLAENLATACTKALAYLSKTESEGVVVQQVSPQLGLTEALTRYLLTHYTVPVDTLMTHLTSDFAATTGVVDEITLATTFDGWFWARRVGAMVAKWKLTLAELEPMTVVANEAQLLDFLTLPLDRTGAIASLDRLLRTSRLLRFRDTLPETHVTLLEVLVKLHTGAYATVADFASDVQGLNNDWLASDVERLMASLDLDYPDDYLFVESWDRLRRSFYFLNSLNAGPDTIKTFAAATMTDGHAKTLKELLRSKFGAETWLVLSAEIQDVLRERKRDAIAAYLLSQPEPADAPSGKWENTNDLYAYYLLDVEMSACQLTSRLVQGSGSVQLFVQRCFMGLEPEVRVKADGTDGDSAWRWWHWMRKYRVWEANRKVFLWPENWIEPELKKDRSPFFREMEHELMQNDINQHTVETAFIHYLEKLEGVAHLEIAGFYQEDDGDNTIVHVFGRTTGAEPHRYYYRRYDYRQWTPWEKVELDIQGDYLIPAVVNKRLFLFWPVFTELPDEAGNSTVATPDAGQPGVPLQKATKRLKLQMAMSDYRRGEWSPKKISKDFDLSWPYKVEIVMRHYRFFPIDRSAVDGRFGIQYDGFSLGSDGVQQACLDGTFEVDGCEGVPVQSTLHGRFQHVVRPEPDAVDSTTAFLKWTEIGLREDWRENDFTLVNTFTDALDTLRLTRVLSQTPGIFHMTPPWHLSYFDKLLLNGPLELDLSAPGRYRSASLSRAGSWLPFFYHDMTRMFFVLPSLRSGIDGREHADGTSVINYYPEIKKAFRDLEDDLEGEIRTRVNSVNFAVLTDAQRQEIEQFLHSQFPGDTPPPKETPPSYTDEQVRDLSTRYYMRFVNSFLGGRALSIFRSRQFHFKNFYHPFVCDFSKLLYNPLKGIPALMNRDTQLRNTGFDFEQTYQPTEAVVKQSADPGEAHAYPTEVVDFTPDGAFASYNWELFFHAPLMIANQLSQNQRFEEARDWYHFIFNPIGVESTVPGGSPVSKYWITKPFYETSDPEYVQQRIDNILRMLAGDTSLVGFSAQMKKNLEDQVADWRINPFEPHRIANYRTVAYQKTVVMKYVDNLVAWGDYLFQQDSMESINEATQLYILAAEILGPRPKIVPPQASPPVESFNELEEAFDDFSNALVEVENLMPTLHGSETDGTALPPLPMLYFCIPRNDKMLSYWDTIADRLFKIRHCMNIEGVVRQLALFEPPIDPGALVKAVAGGVDIGSALADLNTPLPLYRFNILLRKATEVCNDVKALGGGLLSALEKKDAEELGLLRQSQEVRLLEAVKSVREHQIDEAKESLEGLKKSKELAQIRKQYYESREFMNAGEIVALSLSSASTAIDAAVALAYVLAGGLKVVPQFLIGAAGFGGSPHATAETGGVTFGSIAEDAALTLSSISRALEKGAAIANTLAGYERRQDDWDFQRDLAIQEIDQFDSSIAAAELRIAIAEKELENQMLQIENAKATDEFMRSKYTNEELYQWQVGQISGVFFQSYKLAYDLAKRAERCFRFELGLQDSSYISFGYWDSLKKGLLSGEKLQYDLHRLETAYLEQNRREFELAKHVSLALLNPLALVQLRETGRCFFQLPEELFDLDYPGHYFRRIKSVSLTLPCVTGPYTTVSCTLRLLKNSIRIHTGKGDDGYPRNTDDAGLPADDGRFVEHRVPVKAIAASSAQNDSGLFELSFRDERYLPFEGAGAISEWALELFSDLPANNPDPGNPDFGKPLRQFDYSSISDAILHVNYTAREDAGVFKNDAVSHLRDYFSQDGETPSLRMFNLRQEFPTQWHRFLYPANPTSGNIFELEMAPTLFPLRDRGKTLKINTICLAARCANTGSYNVVMTPPLPGPPPAGADTMTLNSDDLYGGLHFGQKDVVLPDITIDPTGPPVTWRLNMTRPGGGNLHADPVTKVSEVEDLLLILGYAWE